MKKAISLLLTLIIALCCAVPSFASNDIDTYQTPYIETRFSALSNVYIYLAEDDFGFLHIEGSAGTSSSEKYVKITVTLEHYGYNSFESMGDDFTWSAEGYFGVAVETTRDVPVGSYRARIDAQCWENNVLKDDVTFYSDIANVAK